MSALPPKADISRVLLNVRFVPEADIPHRTKMAHYSISSSLDDLSARNRMEERNVGPV